MRKEKKEKKEERKKKEKERKKERKKRKKKRRKEIIFVSGQSKIRLHSEPSEREARTTCERQPKKIFVTQPKTQRPTLILSYAKCTAPALQIMFY